MLEPDSYSESILINSAHNSLPLEQEEHEILGSTNKLSLYKAHHEIQEENHKNIAAIYKRSQLKAAYDSNIIKNIVNESKRYKYLKPQIVFKMLGEHRKYSFLKKFAISRLEENLKKQLDLFYKITSWNWNDFQMRRRLTNFVWVDVLLRTEDNCLNIYKFQQDLEQLQKYVEKIFDVLFSNIENKDIDIYEHVEKSIDEAKKVLYTINHVEDELYSNTKELKQLIYKERFVTNAKRHSEEKFLKFHLENRIWNSHIWDPIEIRYSMNWFHNIVKQTQYHMDSVIEKYQVDINKFKKVIELEEFIDHSCMDFLYSSIENYKNRINEMQEKFEKEFEIMENRLTYKRIQINKLRDQIKWMKEEIEHFHKEEELMCSNLAKEDEEKERKRLKDEKEPSVKAPNKKRKKRNFKSNMVKPASVKGYGKESQQLK